MIVGFNFNKINIERRNLPIGKIKVSPNIDIKEVKEHTLPLKGNKKALNVNFEFSVKYEPNIADIMLNGDVLYMNDNKSVETAYNIWKKNKKLPEDISLEIVNYILIRCNVKALELSDELNLPSHLPIRGVDLNRTNLSSYIG